MPISKNINEMSLYVNKHDIIMIKSFQQAMLSTEFSDLIVNLLSIKCRKNKDDLL